VLKIEQLLTKKDLAQRWQVSERTIDQYREDGIIIPVNGIPCIRYNLQYIQQIEGCIPEKTTLRERKLEKELKEWKYRAEKAEKIIAEINIMTMQNIYKLNDNNS
jgi:hypothetical protein